MEKKTIPYVYQQLVLKWTARYWLESYRHHQAIDVDACANVTLRYDRSKNLYCDIRSCGTILLCVYQCSIATPPPQPLSGPLDRLDCTSSNFYNQ